MLYYRIARIPIADYIERLLGFCYHYNYIVRSCILLVNKVRITLLAQTQRGAGIYIFSYDDSIGSEVLPHDHY
jgi:hypothetical protein